MGEIVDLENYKKRKMIIDITKEYLKDQECSRTEIKERIEELREKIIVKDNKI